MQAHPRTLSVLALLLSSAPLLAAQGAASVEIDHLEQRVQYLKDDYAQARIDNNIPGMAVAVVKDDQILFAQGFGLKNLKSGEPVTPETRFAIGSTTKAFTTALIGMMVDEAKMDWDAPITEYLPYFELPIDSRKDTDEATLRDLLCHRTGFTRMGMLWASGRTTREEILRTATHAEPWSRYRRKFYYNNVMYLAAGVAVGKVSGLGWEKLLQTRILDPLGMQHTNMSYAAAMSDEGMATGYAWQPDLETHKLDPMRNIDTIGPAGAINSNVLDMSRWIRFQLGRGEFEGKRLISEAALTDTWEPNLRVGGGIRYGMGWMITDYHGQVALHHGGNIDGFAAAVALLPESNIGYVMLTNIGSTPLQAPTSTMVWDALLGDFEERSAPAEAQAGNFDHLLGTYIANFGSFKNSEFEVSEKGGTLFVNIPGQIKGALAAPDEMGLRTMKPAPTLQFRFRDEEKGQVACLELHQGGANFEMYRKGHVFELDMPMEELEVFMGHYKDPAFPTPITVQVQSGHLAVDVPGQMVYELHLPDDEGLWQFRAVPSIGLEFEFDDQDRVSAVYRHQDGKRVRCERIEDSKDSPASNGLPSLDEIDELRHLKQREAALAKLGTLRYRATIRFIHSGVEGTLEELVASDGRFLQHVSMGKFGSSDIAFDGTLGWSESAFDPYDEPEGRLLDQLMLTPGSTFHGDWSQLFDKRKVVRKSRVDGADQWVVELARGALPAITVYVNQETGDITRVNSSLISSGAGSVISVRADFSDYREVHGLRVPFMVRTENESSGANVIVLEGLDTNVETPADCFKHKP